MVHDFVRDSIRAALLKARPVPQFTREITAQPNAAPGLSPGANMRQQARDFALEAPAQPAVNERLQFTGAAIAVEANTAVSGFGAIPAPVVQRIVVAQAGDCGNVLAEEPQAVADELALASLKPVGQVRDSFILAVNADGLWIIDQHVAHE